MSREPPLLHADVTIPSKKFAIVGTSCLHMPQRQRSEPVCQIMAGARHDAVITRNQGHDPKSM